MRTLVTLTALVVVQHAAAQQGVRARLAAPPEEGPHAPFSVLAGRPTADSVALSVLSDAGGRAYVEYDTGEGWPAARTEARPICAKSPLEFELTGLRADAECRYRVVFEPQAPGAATRVHERTVRTARPRGAEFRFCVQGDSHPERPGRMYDPDLYVRTLRNAASDAPDFHFMMGDDFSIERLFERKSLSQAAVDEIYLRHRGFVGIVGGSAPLMLVNGNHEQAAKYLLDGTADNGAVYAGLARTRFFPLPAPGAFYTGNSVPVEHIGLLRDYYAWAWGDALFVVIDPYWHSSVVVDNEAGAKAPSPNGGKKAAGGPGPQDPPNDDGGARKGKGQRDLWRITLGDTQFHWLEKTLRESRAPFKFVFCHHVLGTGRGGIEGATRYEWGGQDGGGGRKDPAGDAAPARRGLERFFRERPTWDKPIHALMQETGVTIFFQGHDHLYARQELDGVIYQTCPNPADPTFTAFNREAYRSGDVLPNSGHLRVTVAGGPDPRCTVEYVRSLRPQDEKGAPANGTIAHAYTVKPRPAAAPAAPRKEIDP